MTDAPEIVLEPAARPPRRGPGRIAAAVIAVVAVVAGGVFAANALSGGGNSPEDAVRKLFAAIEREDVLGALEQLDPGERDSVQGSLEKLTAELNRLGILEGASLRKIDGVDFRFEDLAFRTADVREGLATVEVTGGTGGWAITGRDLPLGDFVRSMVGDDLDELSDSGSDPMAGDESELTTVKRGDTWYVSLGYSIAELARKDAGVSVADLGNGVTPKGADSPEAAVRQLFDALAELDVRSMIALVPPDEMGALHDYAGLFLADAERGVAELEGAFTLSFPGLELKAHTDGDRSRVAVVKMGVAAQLGEFGVRYAEGCAALTMPGQAPKEFCEGDDPAAALGELGLPGFDVPELPFADKHPALGFITTRVDGRWYVSPTRTWLDNGVAVLKVLERSDLEAIKDLVQQTVGQATSFQTLESSTTSDTSY